MGAGTVLVTGASGVIGGAIIRRLAQDVEWEGCAFILGGRQKQALEALGGELKNHECRVVAGDFETVVPALAEEVRACKKTWGKVRAVVFAAGLNHDKNIRGLSEKAWDKVWSANVKGHGRLLSLLGNDLLANPAAILLVGSIVGLRGNFGQAAYAAAKGALLDILHTQKKKLAAKGCRINCLFPPLVESPLLANLSVEARTRLFLNRLLQDPSPSRSVAEQAAFLLSKRSSYVHAAVLHGDSRISSLPW